MDEDNNNEILFLCNTCHGTMASNTWIEKNLKPGIIKRLQLPLEEPIDAKFSCPVCPGKMKTYSVSIPLNSFIEEKIQIDRCERCKSIWFDNKELNQVLPDDIDSFDVPFSNEEPIFTKIFTSRFWLEMLR